MAEDRKAGSAMGERPVWTETELDEALGRLEAELSPDGATLARVRSRVLATVAAPAEPAPVAPIEPAAEPLPEPAPVPAGRRQPRRHHRGRWAAVAAGLAAAVAGALALTTVSATKAPPVYAETARTLNAAADLAGDAKDPAVGPGQYLYVATHAWWRADMQSAQGQRFSYLAENLIETWVPRDQTQEWLERRRETGNRQWLVGTEREAKAAGLLQQQVWGSEETRARCGDFDVAIQSKAPAKEGAPAPVFCADRKGGWQRPTPEFLAGLPRDPAALYARLRSDTAGHGRDPDAEVLVYAADALRTGLVPADVRAALFRALAHLPGLKVTDHRANLAGRQGVALGMTAAGETQEIIVDPATGQFIGERTVDGNGKILEFTSVTTGVATTIGVPPAG